MRFEPQPWTPPRDLGLVGEFAVNTALRDAALWDTTGRGPRDIAIDDVGRPVTGLEDGRLIRFETTGGEPTTIADVGGRPLGVANHPEAGGYLVCNASLGVQQVRPDGRVDVLFDSFMGQPLAVTSDAAVASDGTVYVSVSSHRHPLERVTTDFLERKATGAVYRRTLDGDLDVVLDGLVVPGGVVLSENEDFLLVAETGSYRIHRVGLTGPDQGRHRVFRENLPGFPDNLSRSGSFYWCAFPRPRTPALDVTLRRPWMRHLIHRLPDTLQPTPSRHGIVVAFDAAGVVVANLQDPSGRVAVTTSATAFGRTLYVGSLTEPTLAVVSLPPFLD